MFDADQAAKLVNEALPSIVEGLKAELKQSISWQVKEDAAKLVSKHVQEWISANIIPIVTEQLIESKDGLIAIGAILSSQMVSGLTDALNEAFKKKLENSWERSKIVKAIFGD